MLHMHKYSITSDDEDDEDDDDRDLFKKQVWEFAFFSLLINAIFFSFWPPQIHTDRK